MLKLIYVITKTNLQLIENKGEFGVFAGQASYNGDLAPNLQFLTLNCQHGKSRGK